jgi:filamentous hemagglutinin family protein
MTRVFIAAGDPEDDRIQVFAIDSHGKMENRWKETSNPDSNWTPWSEFQTPKVQRACSAPTRSGQRRSTCSAKPTPTGSVFLWGESVLPRSPLAALVSLALTLWCGPLASAQAAGPLPGGGHFVAGSGSINSGSNSVTITQGSARGVIDWNSFSIGSGRLVTFNNGTGATLNRVTGTDQSAILGTLSATGSVYLINPQGVVVGPTGVVATGGRFVASALNADNNAFVQAGALTLSGNGNGVVVNLGSISSTHGDVFLISRNRVANYGTIGAPRGSVELAAGQQVLLQDASASKQVFVQTGSYGRVLNKGTLDAAQISLQAADGNVYALAGNHAAIRASGTAQRDGHVWLVADQGTVHVQGATSAVNAGGAGGTVETTGNALDIAGATVQAGWWKLGAPTFTLDASNAATLAGNLASGTSIDAQATGANGQSGDLGVSANVQWSGGASLTLGAAHSVTTARNVTVKNTGSGNLMLRADANAVDNGGSVTNNGKIDWSASTGIVNALYDMNGSYKAGTIRTNAAWHAAPYSGLVTQASGYRLVNNLTDLQNVSHDLAGNYALGTDIDASATSGSPAFTFTPIGATTATPFTGQFDGMGHTISALTPTPQADPSTQYPIVNDGLFGVIGTAGVVRNVGITDSGISGYTPGNYAPLAAINNGLITYAYATGRVSSPTVSPTIGGLVAINNGTIERSWSSADIGFQGLEGGLVAVNNGTILQSFATGSITGGSHGFGGVLVGTNSGTILQSYATGSIGTLDGGGALTGRNTQAGRIDESFTTGSIGMGGPPGVPLGAIGAYNAGTIANNVYWNKETTHRASASENNTGSQPTDANGLTTAQMTNPASFGPSWDFSTNGTWAIVAGVAHPVLQWQLAH